MPNQRIRLNTQTQLGSRISDCVNMGSAFRQRLAELQLLVTNYGGDVTLQTDTGLSAADALTFTDVLTKAVAEMTGTLTVNLAAGQQTWTRRLLDALSSGG